MAGSGLWPGRLSPDHLAGSDHRQFQRTGSPFNSNGEDHVELSRSGSAGRFHGCKASNDDYFSAAVGFARDRTGLDHRMVRLFHLRHRGRTGFRQAVLPDVRRDSGNARVVRDVCGWHVRQTRWRIYLRTFRRPRRAQIDVDVHYADDGPADDRDRIDPDLRINRLRSASYRASRSEESGAAPS